MALGLVFVMVAVLTGMTGWFLPSAGVAPAQAVGGISLVFVVLAVTSLNEFHHSGRRQAAACRR
jgi:hypothetical protein